MGLATNDIINIELLIHQLFCGFVYKMLEDRENAKFPYPRVTS